MSNEEKYNKVQQLFKVNKVHQLFIEITGCNPEKEIYQLTDEFKEFVQGGRVLEVSRLCNYIGERALGFSPSQYNYLVYMIDRLYSTVKTYNELLNSFKSEASND